ncbi:MAG: type VI secretion system baseplate subunit TssE [Pseudomonadota bacterium]|nr:type VI secretion system baseplate subunit TssE [Pseudomonadota bacterium]
MQGFQPGLFDRLADDDAHIHALRRRSRTAEAEACRASITRDLMALLNTRANVSAEALTALPGVAASVVNYGLIDFAGMCMTSSTDQQKICTAVRMAIQRHEPRLLKVDVMLSPKKGAINRVEFMITAELKSGQATQPLSFNAVFRPSLQQYSIEDAT